MAAHFVVATANRHQMDAQNSLALSAVNAVALARGISWEEAYRYLLNQGHRYGLLLRDPFCVKNMLRDAGYTPVSGIGRYKTYDQLHDYLTAHYPAVTSGLAFTVRNQSMEKRVCAIRRTDSGFVCMDTRQEERTVLQLWLPYDEIGAEKPLPDPVSAVREPMTKPLPNHRGFQFFQPNPRGFAIGDCVIRAYAAVFDVSWDEALEMVARSNEYTTAILNGALPYRYLISEYGMTAHERLTRDGLGLTGVAFCDHMNAVCTQGERFFALVGSDHVVGIVPVETPEGKRYAVKDIWDSSKEKIGRYFMYLPKKAPAPAAPDLPAELAAGVRLSHPQFGPGTIVSLQGGLALVRFPDAGDKKLSLAWIRDHCKGVEDGAG